MPKYEYECPVHGRIEKFFPTFRQAAPYEDSAPCAQNDDNQGACDYIAPRIMSVPLKAHFYGDPSGWYSPSPTKRHSTKLVSEKEGNKNSAG